MKEKELKISNNVMENILKNCVCNINSKFAKDIYEHKNSKRIQKHGGEKMSVYKIFYPFFFEFS